MPGPDGRYARDPVSELFDVPARRLLARAYEARGQWVMTRLADPSPRHVALLASWGINPYGPDNAPTLAGTRQDMRSRWGRGFARSVFYIEKWHGGAAGLRQSRLMTPNQTRSVVIEIGRRVRAAGVIPAGRAVRIRTVPGGAAATRHARKLPDTVRIFDDHGAPADRWSVADERDW
jgi:hypothetical protein